MNLIEELTKMLEESAKKKDTTPVKKIMDADDVKIDFKNADINYLKVFSNKIYRLSIELQITCQDVEKAKRKKEKCGKMSVGFLVAIVLTVGLGAVLNLLNTTLAIALTSSLLIWNISMGGACLLKKESCKKEISNLLNKFNDLQVEKFNILNPYVEEKQNVVNSSSLNKTDKTNCDNNTITDDNNKNL